MSPVWRVAKAKPHIVNVCVKVAKLIAYPTNTAILCEFCGSLTQDVLLHCAVQCTNTMEERGDFWDIVLNKSKCAIVFI